MSRHVLVVEPDPAGRTVMTRVLAASGYAVHPVASIDLALVHMYRGTMDVGVVDELAGVGDLLDGVRFLRAEYPALPIVLTGTMLSRRVLLDVVRLGITEALPKPFTPDDLRGAVARALEHTAPRYNDALDFAAAIHAARRALAVGQDDAAVAALARARTLSPLDAEVMGLEAVRAELAGRDADADRAFRAALALRTDEGAPGPDPWDGLARLAAYGPARPVPALAVSPRTLWLVTDPSVELSRAPPRDAEAPVAVLMALGLTDTNTTDAAGAAGAAGATGLLSYREGGGRAFVLTAGGLDSASAAARARHDVPIVAHEPTWLRVDLDHGAVGDGYSRKEPSL